MTKHGTGIQWTHHEGRRGETWNPTTGCTRVSPGCDLLAQVMPADVGTSAAPTIEQQECLAATAAALDFHVLLAGIAETLRSLSVLASVVSTGLHDLEVGRLVVRLVAVQVVDLFAIAQRASERLLRDQPVLVDVATRVCAWMIGTLQQDIAVRRYRAAALPLGVPSTSQLAFA